MLNRDMAMRSTVLSCCLAAALLAASCGGSGSKSTSPATTGTTATQSATTGSGGTVSRAQACAFAREANTVYKANAAALGLNFKDKAGETKLIESIAQLHSRLQTLSQAAGSAAASQLNEYAAALARQEAVIKAIRVNDFKTAAANAQGLNQDLERGAAILSQTCAGA